MLELGIGASVVRGLGGVVLLVFFGLLAMALLKPKTRAAKAGWTLTVLLVFLGPLVPSAYEQAQFERKQKEASALFEARCRSAGEFIHKRVTGVKGVYLVNLRPHSSMTDQFALEDPAGDAAREDIYIETFLTGRDRQGHLKESIREGAYQYVEVPAAEGGGVIRYTDRRAVVNGEVARENPGTPEAVAARQARYGIESADISTREDREHWVAGNRIRVIDLETSEVLAERIAYIFDRGLGNRGGFRTPWLMARSNACPEFSKVNVPTAYGVTRDFADKVIALQTAH